MRTRQRFIFLTIVFTLLLAGCSLASEPIPAGPVQSGLLPGEMPETPASQPVLAQGEAIYMQNCAACHGVVGDGISEMAPTLAEQGAMLPDFSDMMTVRARSPQEFYDVITHGTISSGGLMPPWQQSLSSTQRWSAAYYIYALNAGEDTLAQGETLYTEEIAACLGEVEELETNALLSPADVIAQYLRDTTACPAAEALTEADLDVLSLYAMLVPVDTAAAVAEVDDSTDDAEVLDEEAEATNEEAEAVDPDDVVVASEGMISGTVTIGEEAQTLTEPVEVSLQGVVIEDNGGVNEVLNLTTTTDAQGNYQFEDVPFNMFGMAYVATVTYDGTEFYNGEIVQAGSTSLDLPVKVYTKSSDTSGISIANLHTFIERADERYVLTQFYVFSNNSDTIPQTAEAFGDGVHGTVAMALPERASGLQFQDGALGNRFILDGNTVYDTQDVMPGQEMHNIIMRYEIPADRATEINVPALYPVETSTFMLPADLQLAGDGYRNQGEREAGDTVVTVYAGERLDAGETFTFTVRPQILPDVNWAQIGAVLMASALAAVAIVSGVRALQNGSDRKALSPEHALVAQIADLDTMYENGEINRIEYESRRALLKLELLEEHAASWSVG